MTFNCKWWLYLHFRCKAFSNVNTRCKPFISIYSYKKLHYAFNLLQGESMHMDMKIPTFYLRSWQKIKCHAQWQYQVRTQIFQAHQIENFCITLCLGVRTVIRRITIRNSNKANLIWGAWNLIALMLLIRLSEKVPHKGFTDKFGTQSSKKFHLLGERENNVYPLHYQIKLSDHFNTW